MQLGILDPNVRLEVITEFLEAPQPSITEWAIRTERDPARRAQLAEPDFMDQILSFGNIMQMASGRAFDLGDGGAPPGSIGVNGIPTGKRWQVAVSGIAQRAHRPRFQHSARRGPSGDYRGKRHAAR